MPRTKKPTLIVIKNEEEALSEAVCSGLAIHEEITGTRRSYACHKAIVEHEGELWALEWNANEEHNYATAAYKVKAREVTTVVYDRIEE